MDSPCNNFFFPPTHENNSSRALLLVGAWTAGDAEAVTRLRRELASPPSSTPAAAPPGPVPEESPPFRSSESSGNPASRRKISTDSVSLFFLRNCSTASSVCWSSGAPAAGLAPPADAPEPGDGESSRPSLALLFPKPSLDGSVFISFSSSASTRPPCTAAIFKMKCACARFKRKTPAVQDRVPWLVLADAASWRAGQKSRLLRPSV